MSYSCEKCNYHTIRRDNYNRHMESSKHKTQSNEIIDTDLICNYCNKQFKHNQSVYRHIKYTCKKNKDEDLKELVRLMNLQLEKQRNQMIQKDREIEYHKQQNENHQKQIDKLMDKLQVNHITNNTTNINILSYRETDLSHLTNRDYERAIKKISYCVKDIIEKIHFNPLKPENMNIYISNMKDKYIMVYEEGNWNIKNKNTEIDHLYESKEILLEDWLEEYGTEELRQKYNKYISNKENDEIINNIKEEIKMMMYNKKFK